MSDSSLSYAPRSSAVAEGRYRFRDRRSIDRRVGDRRMSGRRISDREAANDDFIRQGPVKELSSYPQWTQEMVESCEEAKQRLLNHEIWTLMKNIELDRNVMRNFLIGSWPVVEQFPQVMALSLLKARYARNRGMDMARRWLILNMRVEQKHAQLWLDWAEACGISRKEMTQIEVPSGALTLSHWCWQCGEREDLPTAMAANNYALEGATGEWAAYVTSSPDYENSFEPSERHKAMRWLKAHASYDDTHPWEALEIICTLMGNNPAATEVAHLGDCIRKTYEYKTMSLEHCFMH